MKNQEKDIEILLRQLDGSASADEKKMLLQWLEASEANRADYREIRDLWLSCDVALQDGDQTRAALNRMLRRIRSESSSMGKEKQSLKRSIRRYYAVAAVILVMLVAGYRWLLYPGTFADVENEPVIYNRLITAQGGKGKFTLPDGSLVWLNAESMLVYPEKFEGTERRVQLDGEGYFEVAENREKPFIVQSGNLTVEALGTTFDVSRYPFRHKTEVVLLDGSVRVTSPAIEKDVVLSPDQMLELTGDGTLSVHETTARMHASWIKDKLVFDNDRLSDIILSLEGWYCIDIECPPAFAEDTRMSFTVGAESIEEILRAMSLVIPVAWSITDSVATISVR
ncbi:MAG: FecR domain-containing protein [Tannerella sp.]|jgi:ferric-dicitrate binding protein FerR (iron transport regulator)|nr:FecR domain-containing protein [Tannerella sp.]